MNLLRLNGYFFMDQPPASLAGALRQLADHLEAAPPANRCEHGLSFTVSHDSARYNASLGWRLTAQAYIGQLGADGWRELPHGVTGAVVDGNCLVK